MNRDLVLVIAWGVVVLVGLFVMFKLGEMQGWRKGFQDGWNDCRDAMNARWRANTTK